MNNVGILREVTHEAILKGVPGQVLAACDRALAALRTAGATAPLVVDGAIDGERFLGWVTATSSRRCSQATSW